MNINPDLIYLAQWRIDQLSKQTEKSAFVPPGGGDPSQSGAPQQSGPPPTGPADPNGQPIDPSQGGAPPMAGGPGGAPPMPGAGGMTADTIQQIVQQVMQGMGGAGGGTGGGGGAGGGAGGGMGKPARPDINTVAIDIFQVKKMFQYLFNSMGIPLPPDILDGPNRDPSTGVPMMPGAPGSTSDPSVTAQNAQNMQQGGQGGAGGGQGGGPIPPIQPMEGAGPAGGGATKTSEDMALYMGSGHTDLPGGNFDPRVISKAAALSALYRRLRGE